MNDKPDISTLFSLLSENKSNSIPEELIHSFINSSSISSENNIDNQENNSSNVNSNTQKMSDNMPDMETIMKLMSILKSSNQDSPDKNLLYSLKPFLNDSRKQKVDQYVKILGITKALENFNELGDLKNE